MSDPDLLIAAIKASLKMLPERKIIPVNSEGKLEIEQITRQVEVSKNTANLLRKDPKYASRCKLLARKYGCSFEEQTNGEFIFRKKPD